MYRHGYAVMSEMEVSILSENPKLIGVCLSTLFDEDRYGFISKFNKYAVDAGYRLIIFNSDSDLYEQFNKNNEGAASVFRLIPYEKLSALIIFPAFIQNDEIIAEIAEKGKMQNIPVISIDREIEGCFCFAFNYADAFENICRHVIEFHGAKKIYLITGKRGNNYAEERRFAYRCALESNGIPYDENNVGYGCFWEGPTNDLLLKWFDIEKREVPDAIICANDVMAITVSRFLQSRGYSIPEQCIVTGFDNIEQAKMHTPHITTCHQNYDEMCRRIIEKIEEFYSDEDMEITEFAIKIGFNMIFSRSCGCCDSDKYDINAAVQNFIVRNSEANEREAMMCSMQSSISKMSDMTELPAVMVDKFGFHTIVIAMNRDAFMPPHFGSNRMGKESFTSKVDIIHQRYYWYDIAPCIIDTSELIPYPELLLKRNEPIIVCGIHFMEMAMGYCVFQPDMGVGEYQKIHSFIVALGAALGNFHSRHQIKMINQQLLDANRELHKLSQRDFMTGLLNRRGFYDKLESIMSEVNGNDSRIVIISADLDRLKYINDTFGHLEGDNAITTVGRALVSSSVQGEICARFGGDEFCVAAVVDEEEAKYYFNDFKDRFCDYLYDYNRKSGKEYVLNASIGCCVEKIQGRIDIEEMIKIADENMYIDKMEHRSKNK